RFAGRVPRLHGPHLRGVLADTRVPRALTRTPGPGGIRPGLGYVPVTRTTDSPALELRGATKRYGDVTAVDGLDLTFARGRVLALLGPNGAGKTTTIEMCEGFVRPDGGELRVLGLDPTKSADELRTRVGIMLQGGGAYPGVRVGEML